MARVALCLEDDEKMPISKAFKCSYNGANVFFSSGNRKLYTLMQQKYDDGYTLVIGFMDLPPDNIIARHDFEEALQCIEDDGLVDNLVLLPVICTEYLVLRLLDVKGWLSLGRNALVIWNRICDNKPHGVANKSLEKVCKAVIGESRKDCQRNTNAGSGGRFYTSSCVDCYKHCYASLSLEEKVEWIYSCLPCFDVVSREHEVYLRSFGIMPERVGRTALTSAIMGDLVKIYSAYSMKVPVF